MPNINILKLNDILREKSDEIPKRGKIKSIQISDKIVEGLKNKNISSSTIEKLSRMQGTIVSDRREVHHKIDGYDFYITDYRGKRGNYETVKVSYRTEKLLAHQNVLKTTDKSTKKIAIPSKIKKTNIKKLPVLKSNDSKEKNVGFVKTIVDIKPSKTRKKVNREKLLNEDLKVIDFKKLEQEKNNKATNDLKQIKKSTVQRKKTKPSLLPTSKIVEQSNTVKSNPFKTSNVKQNSFKLSKVSKESKNSNQSNFKSNNIATKQIIKQNPSISKKPNSIAKNQALENWFSSSQVIRKSNFWDKIIHVTKTILNYFNVTRLIKRSW